MSIFDSLIVSKPNEEFKLREESEDDYIEYKLRLDSKTKYGIDRLISQMNYRFDIGKMLLKRKEAHYILGICDNGSLGKLNEIEIDKTFAIFSKIVNDNNSIIVHIEKKVYSYLNNSLNDKSYLIYCIVQKIETFQIKELNVVFVGPTQHGKTTTIGHLAYGQKDNGTGYGRNLIFKHSHEKVTGSTSSIKKEIVGLRKGTLVNYNVGISNGWEDIVEISDKIINIIDLPGNLKYFKSTFFGLSTYDIDGIVIVMDPTKLTELHSNEIEFYKLYAQIFNIPYVMLTIDNTESTITDDLNTIKFSNVTGKGMDKFIHFLNTIEKSSMVEPNKKEDPLFCISETFCVPDVGTIFSGIMKLGSLSIGDIVYLTDGNIYFRTKIKSIQRKQIDSKTLYTGENGAIQLDFDNFVIPEVTKHMIITTSQYVNHNTFEFEILGKTENFTKNQQCVMFVDNMVSTIIIETSDSDINSLNHTVILKSTNNIIVPTINLPNCVAFLKHENGVVFGRLSVNKN